MFNLHQSKLRNLILLLLGGSMSLSVFSQSHNQTILAKIKMATMHDMQDEIIIQLFDNPASRQLLTQLPLSLSFSDYAGAEKIAHLPEKLITNNMLNASKLTGDFTYYAPWGNLAVFYRGMGTDSQLYSLGYIESGKENLAKIKQNFTATIELISS